MELSALSRNRKDSIEKVVMIERDLHAKTNLVLTSHIRGKPTYGAWSRLINELLRQWLESQEESMPKLEELI